MGRCVSPCLGDLDPNAYRRQLDAALAHFEEPGAGERLVEEIDARMREASSSQRFERAAALLRRKERLAWVLERLDGQLRATHSAPRLVLAQHPVKERFDAFWIVPGPAGRLGPAAGPERAGRAHRGRARAAGGRTVVPVEEVDELRIVAGWVADHEPPALGLAPPPTEPGLLRFVAAATPTPRPSAPPPLQVLEQLCSHELMMRRPASAPKTVAPMLFGSMAKCPSTNVPPWASASTKRVVTPVPSQRIDTSRHSSSRSIRSSCSVARNSPLTTPR